MCEIIELIHESWKRCYRIKIPKELNYPLKCTYGKELKRILVNNQLLINIFKKQIKELKNYNYINDLIILLTDSDGMLLDSFCSDVTKLAKFKIRRGVYFTEESCGTNAITLAMIKKKKLQIRGDDHYCLLLQKWESIASPIIIDNNIIGYLNISISEKNLKQIVNLIFDYSLNKIRIEYIENLINNDNEQHLNEELYEVLLYTALGYSIKKISKKLYVSESTINYRRKIICKKLNASNMFHAITKAFKYNILRNNIIKNDN